MTERPLQVQESGTVCPFCGETHDPGPVGELGSWLEGVQIQACPKIPAEHVYEGRQYESGPSGALHRLSREEDPDA